MGKNKSCDAATRKIIVNFHLKQKWSYRKIADYLECSVKMVFNALAHFKLHGTSDNVPRKLRPRKTTVQEDRLMLRLAKADPFKGSNVIRKEVFSEDDPRHVSTKLVRRRLVEGKLLGRIARKVPLLTRQHRENRLAFARKYSIWTIHQWKKVLFSDETKINLINSDGKRYVRRPINEALNNKYTKKTVKHGGGNVMVWGCFSGYGIGPVRKIEGQMDQYQYKKILEETMIPHSEENLPVTWIFQHDNDPKHTARSVKAFLTEQSVTVLEWPANSPDLNPIENLWHTIKTKLSQNHITNIHGLYSAFENAWRSIPVETCNKLVESMPRRCKAVIDNRGYPTKY